MSWFLSKKIYTELPAISGKKLVKLLKKDGWVIDREANHGKAMKKFVSDRWLVIIIPSNRETIPHTTLGQILGPKQSKIGRAGLLVLINKYGI